MGSGPSHNIAFREIAILSIAIVLSTAVGTSGIIYTFERNRDVPEHDVLMLVMIVFIAIIVVLSLVMSKLKK